MPPFNPEWDIDYLFHKDDYQYCVIKKPEPLPGEKKLMVREGCTVYHDGRWYYWRLLKPKAYETWKADGRWDDRYKTEPNKVVTARLNKGQQPGVPAPVFKPHDNNNWGDHDPRVVPWHLTEEMLGDLMLAHMQLSDELQEGKKPEPVKEDA